MNRQDWTLLAISFAESSGISPVQLQKSLFVLGQELPNEVGEDFYQFSAYNYGPFSKQIYLDAERLAITGYITIDKTGRYPVYFATAQGAQIAQAIVGNASRRAVNYLKRVLQWAQSKNFATLVRAIYDKYPEFKANSVFAD